MALRHKGLVADEEAWRFTEKDTIAFSGQKSLPLLVDGATAVTVNSEIAQVMSPTTLGDPDDPVYQWRAVIVRYFLAGIRSVHTPS